MKRLLAVCPNIDDATSFWRGVGPLSQLDGWHVTFATEQRFTWSSLMPYDALFVQRPASSAHVALILMAKEMNIPTWIDYDDDVLNVPYSNPSYATYCRPDIQGAIKACLQAADAVTVSTEPLKSLRNDAVIIPNAWNDLRFPLVDRDPPPVPTIVWRGSSTHDEDILSHADDIVRMYNDFPEYRWVFLGGCPWQLLTRLEGDRRNFEIMFGMDVIEYFRTLEQVQPTWVIVPLKDTGFNRAKSNIAWQEATWAGAACLTPWWPEWQGNGACTYTNNSMYAKFAACHDAAQQYVDDSRFMLQDHYLLSDVNRKREELLSRLLCKTGK